MAVIICLLGVMAQQVNAARIEVAEGLLVNLRSEDLASGSVSEWPNRGTLGGVFTAVGNPVVETVGDWDSVVSLDGQSYFEGPVSPAGIVGGGTRSIEVWAYNIGESKEECMVAWSHRGGPDGTNMTFNYGWKDFGAAGHWGDADMAWGGDHVPYPALETWWHLVYTYDGTTIRLYVNGDPAGERVAALNTHGGNIIRVGTQTDPDGSADVGEKTFSGAIAQVRIHDGVLTPEQIQHNAKIRIEIVGQASNPMPKNGDPDVPLRDLILSWEPGLYPGTHTVYFSEDMNAVESGTAEVVSDVDANSYDPGPLNYETTYYWRVDEVNDSPDKTVYEGSVWSFRAEPYAMPIPAQAISATASSQAEGQGPENTINESGLVDDLHSTEIEDMWVTVEGQALPAWIQYEFDKTYKLHEMLVWNYNGVSILASLGLQDVTVEYSTDGVDWILNDNVSVFNKATGTDDYAADTTVPFGDVPVKYVKITVNGNWGGDVFTQYGLSEVRFLYIPVRARYPSPQDDATGVAPDVALSWRAGREAALHEVYFSSNGNAVANGTALVDTVSETSYAPGYLVALGQTYYWKISEVNEAESPSSWEGDVWSFATIEYLVVDDFENYNDYSPDRIFETWKDGYGYSETEFGPGYCGNGTGATVGHATFPYAEQTIVHEGSQSMPFYYDNSGTGTNSCGQPISLYYSETERTFDTPQDWTKFGIKALSLWFRGDPGNSITEQMYVKINGTKVTYDGDANDLARTTWFEWNIDLAAAGVSLSNVTELGIGFDRTGASGGIGVVYFDDIRLYPSRCVLSKRSADFAEADFAPAGNPAGDCIIDYREIEIIARDWLFEDQIIAPTEDPGLTGIHAYYPLNEGQGITVSDLSGNNPAGGTIDNPNGGLGVGDSAWDTDPERGTVLSFSGDDGTGAFVVAGTIPALGLADNFTWAFWAKQADGGTGANDVIIGNRDGGTQSPLQFIKFTPTNFEYYNGDNSMFIDYNDIPNDQWIHHATVKSGTTLTYYRNSVNYGASTVTSTMDANPFLIGGDVRRERWRGWISEVRLYSRALSQAEIAYLADTTPDDGRLHFPVPSAAELYEAELEGSRSVDLRDFAVLANVWLEQQLWP